MSRAFTSDDPAPHCPLCGAGAKGPAFPYAYRWEGKNYEVKGCAQCGCAFVDPMPDGAELARMYAQGDYHDEHYAVADSSAAQDAFRRIGDGLPKGASILDFGCGNGAFLKAAIALGYRATGVEMDPEAARAAAAASGAPALSLAEHEAGDARYDIIHLGDVMEHLPDPAARLHELERHLAPGGMFFLEGPLEDNPNLVSAASRLFGAAKRLRNPETAVDLPPYHLTRWSTAALRRFVEKRMGYSICKLDVWEDGWPYRHEGRGFASRVKNGIASGAIALDRIVSPLGLRIGNRFLMLAQPARRA